MAYFDPYYPRCKEDCYWYGEWQDMGARIPYCKCKKEKGTILGPKDCVNCAEYHSKYKKTNADRIRNMSDEELAKFITSGYYQPHCPVGSCPVVEDCEDCWMEWLKKEVEE